LPSSSSSSPRAGLLFALAAYLAWGFIAFYFNAIKSVPAATVLGHRIVWSVAFLVVVLAAQGQLVDVARCFRSRRTLAVLLASTLMIAVNWYTFIWAIEHSRLVEASFGYFINPLVNFALAVVVLKERLRPWQLVAIALAIAGVAARAWLLGGVPIIALALAFSFGFYGLLRKVAPVGPLVGLSVETILLLPAAVAYLFLAVPEPLGGLFTRGPTIGVLLMLGGVVTALPLLWFAAGARRLPLATMGFLQYLAPSCQLAVAVLAFKNPFDVRELWSFALIWSAIAVFVFDTARRLHASRRPEPTDDAAVVEPA
jgi:chloramphenicol-sensitive protein RarD